MSLHIYDYFTPGFTEFYLTASMDTGSTPHSLTGVYQTFVASQTYIPMWVGAYAQRVYGGNGYMSVAIYDTTTWELMAIGGGDIIYFTLGSYAWTSVQLTPKNIIRAGRSYGIYFLGTDSGDSWQLAFPKSVEWMDPFTGTVYPGSCNDGVNWNWSAQPDNDIPFLVWGDESYQPLSLSR